MWERAGEVNPNGDPLLWFHCASLGEFEQARPLLEKCRIRFPEHILLVTFFSPSGYEVRKNYKGADHVLYLPLDGKRNARKWIEFIKPTAALFIKYEFWNFYLKELEKRDIPSLSVSAIFRPDQSIFRPWGKFQRNMLNRITHFFVQDQQSQDLLNHIGINDVTVSGDTRFDRVYEISRSARHFPEIESFINERETFMIGSAWPADMDVIIPFINEYDLAFIIAPHEIEKKFMDEIESDLERKCVRYTEWEKRRSENFDVMIIDNIGMLAHLYKYGKYAWVGGGFGQGLHNILEAAVFGVPVFFGNKNYSKFREARDLINLGGGFAVGSYFEFKENFNNLNHDQNYQIAKEINTEYIQSQRGATKVIMDYLAKILT